MPGVYVGDTKSLVFPMLCDGYIKQVYGDLNLTNPIQELGVRGGLWGQTTPFTFEAIITPYDVNGYGTKTGTGVGISDSQKTSPSLSIDVTSNEADYQSNSFFTDRTAQKMHLFYNRNFEVYLENTTISTTGLKNKTFNRPAEYRIVAKIHQDNTTKVTATSDTIIKPNNLLHGYYDAVGFYDGINTELTQVSANAMNAQPSKVITVSSNSFTGEVNAPAVASTGSVTFDINNNAPSSYFPATSASASITFNNNNFAVDTTPVAGTGTIEFHNTLGVVTTNASNRYIQVVSEDGNTTTRWFPVSGLTYNNNVDLSNVDNFSSGDRGFTVTDNSNNVFSRQAQAKQFHDAVNAWNNGWAGSVAVGLVLAGQDDIVTFTAAIRGTSPNRLGTGGDLSTGSGIVDTDVEVTSNMSGGVDEVVSNESITINTGSGDKKYRIFSSGVVGSIQTSSSVNYITFRKGNSLTNTMASLVSAINDPTNGNTEVTASALSNNGVTLTANTGGTNGNSFTITTSNMSTSNTSPNPTISSFSGGVNENIPNEHIQLTDADGTTVKFLAAHPTTNSNNYPTGSTITLSGIQYVIYRLPSTGSNRANFANAVNNATNLDITATNDGVDEDKVNLTQDNGGTSGNTSITGVNTSNITAANFSGGLNAANPTDSLDITDAGGVLKKYKPSTNASGETDTTYEFFQIGADNNATATNLASKITSAHGGNISATPSNNTVTIKILTIGNSYAISNNLDNIALSNNNTTFDTSGVRIITVQTTQADTIGAGEKIYDVNARLIGTTADVSGNDITLDADPLVPVTSVIYASQPREALYVESTYRISCSYNTNSLRIYVNGNEVASQPITTTILPHGFFFDPSDCRIGQGETRTGSSYSNDKANQFMGEMFEVCMHSSGEPSPRNSTLSVGLSDIIFYYRFGDE